MALDDAGYKLTVRALDAGVRAGRGFGLQGESLGNYPGTALQTVNPVTMGEIRSFGIDLPEREDLAPAQTAANRTACVNLIRNRSSRSSAGIEQTWRRTDYKGAGARDVSDHGWAALGSFLYGF